jgi:hypothetical protein
LAAARGSGAEQPRRRCAAETQEVGGGAHARACLGAWARGRQLGGAARRRMPACGALWPAPECGWAGYCAANASCVCDAGWQVNLPEVDGVVLCTQRAGGAGVTALYMMWAVGLSVNTALQCTIWWIKHRLGRLIDFPDWAEQSGLLCALALWLAVALRGAQQEEWQVLRSRESLLMFLAGLTCVDIPGALVERKKVKFTLKQIGNQMDSEGGASMLKCFSVFNLSAPTFVLIADLGSIYAVELPLPDCLRVHMCYEFAAACLRLVVSRRMMVPLKRKFDELYEFANSNAGTDPEKLLTLRQAKAELDARIKLLPVFVGLRLALALLTAWPFMISMMTFVFPGLCAFSTVPHMFAMAQ